MISRLTILLVLSGITLSTRGQYNDLILGGVCDYTIQASGNLHAGSDALTRKLYFDFRNGGYLPPSLMRDAEESLHKLNIVGGYNHYDLTGTWSMPRRTRRDTLYLITTAGYHEIQELRMPKDAALIALNGNLPYEGDTMDFAHFRYQLQKFQHYKAGLMKATSNDKGCFYAGFAAGINLGLQQMLVNVHDADLYTAPFGESISLYTRMEYARSAPELFKPFGVQGIGPVLDFFYAWRGHKGTSLAVSFTQLGFTIWNDRSYSYKRDTSYLYEGLIVDNIFNMGEGWDEGLSLDTLDHMFNLYGSPHRHYTSLPLTFELTMEQPVPGKPLLLRGSLLYRHQTLMKPYLSLSMDWLASDHFTITPVASYGGYQGFSGGALIRASLPGGWQITVGSKAMVPAVSAEGRLCLDITAGIAYRGMKRTTKDPELQ